MHFASSVVIWLTTAQSGKDRGGKMSGKATSQS